MIYIDLNINKIVKSADICQDYFPKAPGIYYCYCIGNNKGYVGQSEVLYSRIRNAHIPQLRGNRHHNQHWQNSWNKYGEESFTWTVLELCSEENLNEREVYWIKKLNTICPNGFNLTNGGDKSFKVSEETRKKISETWDASRKEELGKRTKEKWDSMTEEEHQEMCQKFVDAWTDERKKLISSKRANFWSSVSEEKRKEVCKNISKNHADVSGENNPRACAIKCIETGEIFSTIKKAANRFGINYSTLKGYLKKGKNYIHGYHFEYVN